MPQPSTNIRMQQSRPEGSPTRIKREQLKREQLKREQLKHKQSNQKPTKQSRPLSSDVDQHMQAAWQIAKALKTGKWRSTKLKAERARADLFQASDAKRQFGIAICEHLRASLQQQMAWEQHSQQQQSASQQQQ